jgi:hypothetical protein
MRMICGRVHLQLGEHLAAEDVLREHSLDRLLDGELGLPVHQVAVRLSREPAGDPGVRVEVLLLQLVAGELHLARVDDDDEIARVAVRGVGRLVLPRQDRRDPAGETPEGLAGGIDDEPLAGGLGFGRLGLKGAGLHGSPSSSGARKCRGAVRSRGRRVSSSPNVDPARVSAI